jgi:hypothetical protein
MHHLDTGVDCGGHVGEEREVDDRLADVPIHPGELDLENVSDDELVETAATILSTAVLDLQAGRLEDAAKRAQLNKELLDEKERRGFSPDAFFWDLFHLQYLSAHIHASFGNFPAALETAKSALAIAADPGVHEGVNPRGELVFMSSQLVEKIERTIANENGGGS